MEDCWQFYRFDYIRYQTLRPALRSATTPAAFAVLAEDPETEAITNALMDGTISLHEARSAFVQAVCCLGDPLNLDSGLPRSITALARWRETEDAADILAELLTSRKNMEA